MSQLEDKGTSIRDHVAVKAIWVTYGLIVVISSLIGDSLILIASIKYKTFKLHKFVVAVMQHISLCDLINSINYIMFIIYQLSGHNYFCSVRVYIVYYTAPLSFYFTAALTTGKLVIIKYPLTVRTSSGATAHKICLGLWVFTLLFPGLVFLLDKKHAGLYYRMYSCNQTEQVISEQTEYLRPILGGSASIPPMIVVTVSTIWLILRAKRVAKRDTLKWQGLLAVILTAAVFCLSVLPMTIYLTIGGYVEGDWFHVDFYLFAGSFLLVSTISNFYIYSLTVRSFREWLLWNCKGLLGRRDSDHGMRSEMSKISSSA